MQTCGWQLLHTSNSEKMALLCWPTVSQNRARLVAVVCYWDLHIQRSCKNTFLGVELELVFLERFTGAEVLIFFRGGKTSTQLLCSDLSLGKTACHYLSENQPLFASQQTEHVYMCVYVFICGRVGHIGV